MSTLSQSVASTRARVRLEQETLRLDVASTRAQENRHDAPPCALALATERKTQQLISVSARQVAAHEKGAAERDRATKTAPHAHGQQQLEQSELRLDCSLACESDGGAWESGVLHGYCKARSTDAHPRMHTPVCA